MTAAAALLASGALSSAGQLYTNQQNLQAQQQANAESINLANTAHQREVLDLALAGLNPILSASGSGASVPTLGVQDVQNPVKGIADGINSASHYSDPQYRENLQATKLQNNFQTLINDAAAVEKTASITQAEVDQLNAEVELEALQNEMGITHHTDRHGVVHTDHDPKQFKKFKDLIREGIRADAKQRSNSNWRANLSSFMPFVSPVNSAASSQIGTRLGTRFNRTFLK